MKYILFLLLFGIGLIIPQNSFAQTAAEKSCSGKTNGASCSYQLTFNNAGNKGDLKTETKTYSGFCARSGGNLSCNDSDPTAWEKCVKAGDACKYGGQLGVCPTVSPRGTTCDTTKKPAGNPGVATAPDGSATVPNTGTNTAPDGSATVPTGTNGNAPDASSPQSVGFTNPIKFSSIPELIAGIINALLGILGAITVAILVLSGFKYMTASNPGAVGQAIDGIRNAIVGLMIIMGAFLITQYIISALV